MWRIAVDNYDDQTEEQNQSGAAEEIDGSHGSQSRVIFFSVALLTAVPALTRFTHSGHQRMDLAFTTMTEGTRLHAGW